MQLVIMMQDAYTKATYKTDQLSRHLKVEIYENVPAWNRMNGGDRFQNRKFCGTNNPTLMAGTLTFTGRVFVL